MHYACRYCGTTGEWHYEHADVPGCMFPVAARDDLIRLVVGMQWREALQHIEGCGVQDGRGHMSLIGQGFDVVPVLGGYPTASDIVDEWLGVR